MTPRYAAFPRDEHKVRLARARTALAEAGFAGAVAVAPETLYYLAGYDAWVAVNSPQALIFTTGDDDPTLVLRNVDRPLARETCWLDDVRDYHLFLDDAPGLVAEVVREKGLQGRRLAIETGSAALPHALGLALSEALAPAELADATELLGCLRTIKSPLERALIERAAGYAKHGLEAARAALRPGLSEIGLAAALEDAMRRAGSDYWAIPTELAGGPRAPGGHATPRERTIEPGELVHLEFAGVAARYHAVAIHCLAAGAPNARTAEVYELARASLAAGIAAIRPGVPVAAVEEASLDPLRAAGLEGAAMMRFGYGIGIAYPPVWLESMQIARGVEQRLEPGMVFVLHACLELEDEGIGVIQGGTYALDAHGVCELVGGGDVPLEVVPGFETP
jgi:Xaa-Pro dipeptidase